VGRRKPFGQQWRGRLRQRTGAELESMIADAMIRFDRREAEDIYTGDAAPRPPGRPHPMSSVIALYPGEHCLCSGCLTYLIGNAVDAANAPDPPTRLQRVRDDIQRLRRHAFKLPTDQVRRATELLIAEEKRLTDGGP
jgi:hypothetical protein